MEEKLDKLKIAEVKEQKVQEVTRCADCPFAIYNRQYADWSCTLTEDGQDCGHANSIPDFCPLRTSEIIVKLKS